MIFLCGTTHEVLTKKENKTQNLDVSQSCHQARTRKNIQHLPWAGWMRSEMDRAGLGIQHLKDWVGSGIQHSKDQAGSNIQHSENRARSNIQHSKDWAGSGIQHLRDWAESGIQHSRIELYQISNTRRIELDQTSNTRRIELDQTSNTQGLSWIKYPTLKDWVGSSIQYSEPRHDLRHCRRG